MVTLLQSEWEKAAAQLGLQIELSFVLGLANGEITVPVLLRYFGDRQGMLIVTDWKSFAPFAQEAAELGFGFSCLSEPREEELGEIYSEGIREMLEDWGWTGEGSPPEWYQNSGIPLGIRNQFFTQKRDGSVLFCYNDSVEVIEGELKGIKGSVVSLLQPGLDGSYLIEAGENGEDYEVSTKLLKLLSD